MNTSTVALLIIIFTVLLYSSGKMPIALVAVLSLVSAVITGVLSFEDAFKGFAGSTVFTIIGMMFIGQALFETGVAEKIGRLAFGRFVGDERKLIIAVFLVTSFLSAFLYNTSVIVIMMPIVASYVNKSGGNLKLKNFYMALSHATIIGSRMTIIGADGFFMAHEVFDASALSYKFAFFEPFPIMLVTTLILALTYFYIIYPLGCRIFDFNSELNPIDFNENEKNEFSKRKAVISASVMVIVALCAAFMRSISQVIPGINLAIISLAGAMILCFTGCIDFEKQLKKLNIDTIIIVGSSSGFAACFLKSGIGDAFVKLLMSMGESVNSPALLVFAFTFGTALITNLMSNAAAVTILTSLAISVSSGLGINYVPLVMAVVCGSASGVMLPTSTSTLTMSMEAGYRYTDYIKIGGIVTAVTVISESAMIILLYGLL